MTTATEKPLERALVRGDVQPMPEAVRSWMPSRVAEASAALELALARRAEREEALTDAREALEGARLDDRDTEGAAVLAGRPLPKSRGAAAEQKLRIAEAGVHAADRVARDAIRHYMSVLKEESDAVAEAIAGRVEVLQRSARASLADLEADVAQLIRLGRLSVNRGGGPRALGVQAQSAWDDPLQQRNPTLQALSTLRQLVGQCQGSKRRRVRRSRSAGSWKSLNGQRPKNVRWRI